MSAIDLTWFVAHTRPRCEKKLVHYCEREGLKSKLLLYQTVHKYRGKTVVFEKPLFPSYVFLPLMLNQRQKVYQSDYVANLLEVVDQSLFEKQLGHVRLALETNLEIRLAPQIEKGTKVRIRSGPLRGVEGWVAERLGMTTVLLCVDFISQAAAVKLEADLLELI